MKVNAITRDIFQREIVGITEEMSTSLRRTAFSSIIWDMLDYACGLLTPSGEMIAQAQTIPAQLGIMSTAIQHVFKSIPVDQWSEGDVIICNDPYKGCTHTPDIVLFSPVMENCDLVAITCTIAHHIDVGGSVPGTEAANVIDVFGEGLRLPPLKLVDAGRPNKLIWDIIANNVRDVDACHGDLRAQISGCRTGERRVKELVKRYGRETFWALSEACLDYAEAYFLDSLREHGNGISRAEIFIEDEVTTVEPMRLCVSVEIRDDTLIVDFEGTCEQRDNGLNCPVASTVSMVFFAVKAALTPDLGQNEGCVRRLRINIPEGTILNARAPAAVSVRHLTQQAVGDLVLRAIADLIPGSAAGCHVSFPTFTAGGIDDRIEKVAGDGSSPYFLIADIIGGGMGGYSSGDGMDAIDTHGGNCALLSAEVMETMSPFRVLRSELLGGTGGVGKYRGGLAMRRDYEVLSSSVVLSGYFQQGHDYSATWGKNGGGNGSYASACLAPDTAEERPLNSKFVGLNLKKGDVIRLVSAGGGGWGNPEKRDPLLVVQDRQEEYI